MSPQCREVCDKDDEPSNGYTPSSWSHQSAHVHGESPEAQFTSYRVEGVLGAESSPSSIMLANVLKIFRVPQISHTATSDLLSDKKKFPYFLRMVPPDRHQVKALLHLLIHFNWTYVSTIFSRGGYGEEAVGQFRLLAASHDICIGKLFGVAQGEDNETYKNMILKLVDLDTRVVVLFTDQEETIGVLHAAKQLGKQKHFVWIGSDATGHNIEDFHGLEDVILGSLSLKTYSQVVPEFEVGIDYSHTISQSDW